MASNIFQNPKKKITSKPARLGLLSKTEIERLDTAKTDANFLDNVKDLAQSLAQIMMICGIGECEALATIPVSKWALKHYDMYSSCSDVVPRKLIHRGEVLRRLACQPQMHRAEVELAYKVIECAFKAMHSVALRKNLLKSKANDICNCKQKEDESYEEQEMEQKLELAMEAELNKEKLRSHCEVAIYEQAAKKTADYYAVFAQVTDEEKLKIKTQIAEVYIDFLNRKLRWQYASKQSIIVINALEQEPQNEQETPRAANEFQLNYVKPIWERPYLISYCEENIENPKEPEPYDKYDLIAQIDEEAEAEPEPMPAETEPKYKPRNPLFLEGADSVCEIINPSFRRRIRSAPYPSSVPKKAVDKYMDKESIVKTVTEHWQDLDGYHKVRVTLIETERSNGVRTKRKTVTDIKGTDDAEFTEAVHRITTTEENDGRRLLRMPATGRSVEALREVALAAMKERLRTGVSKKKVLVEPTGFLTMHEEALGLNTEMPTLFAKSASKKQKLIRMQQEQQQEAAKNNKKISEENNGTSN